MFIIYKPLFLINILHITIYDIQYYEICRIVYKINSCEFNYEYNGRVFFPYSIASLVSHVLTNPNITQNFKFEKAFISRPKVDKYIQQCKDSEILLCSCYVWNWEITLYLAENVKRINPNCLIVFGARAFLPAKTECVSRISLNPCCCKPDCSVLQIKDSAHGRQRQGFQDLVSLFYTISMMAHHVRGKKSRKPCIWT